MHSSTRASGRTPARPLLRRGLVAGVLGAALALAAPLAASAHVSVAPNEAEPGSYSQLSFKVPNESDSAGTIRVEVTLPDDTPFASVSYLPVPGWTTTLTTTPLPKPVQVSGNELTEAVTSVVWQADEGVQIAPGQFQLFTLSVGPVPEVGSVTLPATQTYSDGTVAEWNGDADAEEPAPVLYIEDAPAAGHSSADADASPENVGVTASSTSTDDGLARGIALTGLALGAVALVLAAFALVRGRRRAGTSLGS
jgi:uncharacterized protein YcnI